GELVVGHRYVAARGAMHDRDRRAPIALARDAPVAQAPLDLLLSELPFLQVSCNCIYSRVISQTVILSRIDADALFFLFVPGFPLFRVEFVVLVILSRPFFLLNGDRNSMTDYLLDR